MMDIKSWKIKSLPKYKVGEELCIGHHTTIQILNCPQPTTKNSRDPQYKLRIVSAWEGDSMDSLFCHNYYIFPFEQASLDAAWQDLPAYVKHMLYYVLNGDREQYANVILEVHVLGANDKCVRILEKDYRSLGKDAHKVIKKVQTILSFLQQDEDNNAASSHGSN